MSAAHSVPKALAFDVFGTVVDWRSSIIARTRGVRPRATASTGLAGIRRRLARRLCPRDGPGAPRRAAVDADRRPAPDDPRRAARRRRASASIADDDVDHLNRAWHRLDPWPDSVAGLTRLKQRFVITTLSNGNVSLLTNMAKRAGLPWDCVISAELFHHYKPDPEAYLGCADLLGVRTGRADAGRRPSQRSARRARRRPEDGLRRPAAGVRPQPAAATGVDDGEFDFTATDFPDLADQLGT